MPQKPYQHQSWPAWREGPDGELRIFQSEVDVPKGWTKVKPKAESEPAAEGAPVAPKPAPKRGRPPKKVSAKKPTKVAAPLDL